MGRLSNTREQRGLSLREASASTGIPQDLLAALESEEDAPLAPGGYAERCLTRYEQFLGIEQQERTESTDNEDSSITTGQVHTDPGQRERVPLIRLGIVGFALVAITILVARFISMALESQHVDPLAQASAQDLPDIDITVRAIEATEIQVEVDGELTFAGAVEARQVVRYAGRKRVSVYIPDLTRVTIGYNGTRIEPLGNLSAGRRLVFVDDGS